MAKSNITPKRGSSKKVLIVLSILLILIGGMVIDPLAGLICFVLAGIISFIAVLSGTGWSRYIAFSLFIIIIILTILKFPEACNHYKTYKSKAIAGDIK